MDNQQNPMQGQPSPITPEVPVMSSMEVPTAPVVDVQPEMSNSSFAEVPSTPVVDMQPEMPQMTAPDTIPQMTQTVSSEVNGPSPIPNSAVNQASIDMQPQASLTPLVTLKANKSLLKFILLSIITLGIYSIVFYCSLANNINVIASRYDNKKTMHFLLVILLSVVSLGIVPLVWNNNLSNRMGMELKRRNIDYDISSKDFWIMAFLLSFTIVCPLIYINKLCNASNLLVTDYNQKG